jgi:hypothetical protein
MAHETTPLIAMIIVAASTRYDPKAMCGMNRRTSMRKQRRERMSVTMLRMNIPSRYRGECEGEWRCAVAARMSMMSVKRAAIGCTTRIAERVVLVAVGRSKVPVSDGEKDLARGIGLAMVMTCGAKVGVFPAWNQSPPI